MTKDVIFSIYIDTHMLYIINIVKMTIFDNRNDVSKFKSDWIMKLIANQMSIRVVLNFAGINAWKHNILH